MNYFYNELIYLYRIESKTNIKEILVEDLFPRIKKYIYNHYYQVIIINQINFLDIENVCYISLDKAIKLFDYNKKNSNFVTFLFSVVINTFKSFLGQTFNASQQHFNKMGSYENFSDKNVIFELQTCDQEIENSIVNNNFLQIENLIKKCKFSKLENKVLQLKLEGLENRNIAKILKIDAKKVSNIYQKIKLILKCCYQNNKT